VLGEENMEQREPIRKRKRGDEIEPVFGQGRGVIAARGPVPVPSSSSAVRANDMKMPGNVE